MADSPYRYCPKCGAPAVSAGGGGALGRYDVCEKGHVYPNKESRWEVPRDIRIDAVLHGGEIQKLTAEELEIVRMLGECYNRFIALDDHHPMGQQEFASGVHVLQRQVMARLARRAHPDL